MSDPSVDLPAARASAMRVAQILFTKGAKSDAVEVLSVWASVQNDSEGHKLLAEALRYDPGSPLAQAAFQKMEGVSSDQSVLETARVKWTTDVLAKIENDAKKPSTGWQAEVGYNNNVKYKGQVFHIQTEDSGVKRPHIITHLFADGGRILKSYKRSYAMLIDLVSPLSPHVREWMKGQHKEMFIGLKEGKFDEIIEGRAPGGMETREGPPPGVQSPIPAPAPSAGAPSSPAISSPPPATPSAVAAQPQVAAQPVAAKPATRVEPVAQAPKPVEAPKVAAAPILRARLHVIRAVGDGPLLHEIYDDEIVVGSQSKAVVVGDRFVSPRQAIFRFRNNKLEVEDAGSVNGTFMRIRRPIELDYGDTFIAGDQLLRVDPTPPPNDGPDNSPTYFYSSLKWATTFRVVQVWEGDVPGMCVVARTNILQIGRTASDLNFPSDYWMSDAHCVVEDQGGFLMLTDLGSRAGTFMKLKGPTRVMTGDEILVGRTRLRVELVTTH
ncbi:MAG: FHA domain-containing protein [Polyangiaceae bacterium]